ncbi:putative 4-hydroxybenzoate polyprenyltransferase [bacterium]|nr:putative 4-hydroxybenzoate polyprenyltransferase [bacterium]
MFLHKLRLTFRMIKIEHSVFALPFALISALVASHGLPSPHQLLWILVAMVAARSCAMAFNRVADRKFDSLNPRTQKWPLAAGLLSLPFVIVFILMCAAIFIFAAYKLNPLAFVLSPVALLIIFGYSLTKRFTALSHWFIGLALAVAPAGAWIAIRGKLEGTPLILSLAILFWTAGFDLIYSCQDAEFDRSNNLHSIPAKLGIKTALLIARICHTITVSLLIAFGIAAITGWLYYVGVAIVGVLLIYEHSLVNPRDLSRVNEAFFAVNGAVGVLLLIFVSLDLFFRL